MKFITASLSLVLVIGVVNALPQRRQQAQRQQPQSQPSEAKPRNADQDTVVTRSEFERDQDNNNFNWVSELSDGQTHQQSGTVKQIGDEKRVIITGSYSYVAPDGRTISVNYVADEFGFHVTGDHIPLAIQSQGRGEPLPVRSARPPLAKKKF